MKLLARAPIEDFDGTGDKRPGDTFVCKDEDIAIGLIEVGDAEALDAKAHADVKAKREAKKQAEAKAAAGGGSA